MRLQSGKFVNVVASINVTTGKAEILYVNPSTTTLEGDDTDRNTDVTLVAEDGEGRELRRVHPLLRFPACGTEEEMQTALIQENLPHLPEMRVLKLLHHGVEQARFESGAPSTAAAGLGVRLASSGPAPTHRRSLQTAAAMPEEPGVTYTVQVKPAGAGAWNTVAVGRSTPTLDLDLNQFPGARRATVRILRSTGFDEEIVAEQDVDLGA